MVSLQEPKRPYFPNRENDTSNHACPGPGPPRNPEIPYPPPQVGVAPPTKIRERAARHGVSMEEEVRRILRATVSTQQSIGKIASELFGPDHGVELTVPTHPEHEPVDFTE